MPSATERQRSERLDTHSGGGLWLIIGVKHESMFWKKLAVARSLRDRLPPCRRAAGWCVETCEQVSNKQRNGRAFRYRTPHMTASSRGGHSASTATHTDQDHRDHMDRSPITHRTQDSREERGGNKASLHTGNATACDGTERGDVTCCGRHWHRTRLSGRGVRLAGRKARLRRRRARLEGAGSA